jgi:TonB family protein
VSISCFAQCKIDSSSINTFCKAFNYRYNVHDSYYPFDGSDVELSITYLTKDGYFDVKTQDIIFYDIFYFYGRNKNNLSQFLLTTKMDSLTAQKLTDYFLCKYEAKFKAWEAKQTKYLSENCDPEFPGGIQEMMKFIKANLKYPYPALISKTEGKVFIGFIIDPNGNLLNPTIVKGIGYGCDEEALRIIKSMPRWTGGKQNGNQISFRKSLPIRFKFPD